MMASLTLLLTTLVINVAGCRGSNQGVTVIMFNATLGQYDFTVPGDRFYHQVLHWTNTQSDGFESIAMEYFANKFGLINPKQNPKLNTMLYSTNPNAGMACFVLNNDAVPIEGYPVLDGGWMVTVMDPNGIDLGGQFKGTHVPQGTTMAIGQWYIDRRNAANTTERSPLLWSYQHAAPGIIATVGVGRTSNGEIDVVSQKYGKGKSFHLAKYSFDGKGNANAVFRNVVTF